MSAKETYQILPFGSLLDGSTRNGIYKSNEFHGTGTKIVNMGELFAYPRLHSSVDMRRINLSEKEFDKFALNDGDLIFARRSLVAEGAGKCSIVLSANEPLVFESSIIRARPRPEMASSLYLYYFFSSPQGAHALDTIRRQVAVAGITGSDLLKLEIPLPSLHDQQAIARILGTLDDKIDVIHKMNETLENTAHAIFKSWFIDFDPVQAKAEGFTPEGIDEATALLFPSAFVESAIGLIPEGWTTSSLANACEAIFSGGTPSTKAETYWGGGIPWLSSGETRNHFIATTEKTISSLGIERSSTRRARRMATVIASAGQGHTRGQTSLLMLESYINQSVIALEANRSIASDLYLYFSLSRRYAEFRQISDSHSSRGSLTTKLLAGIDILLPPVTMISRFDGLVSPLVDRIHTNLQEIDVLVDVRNKLLPKLLTGEIHVDEANSRLEAVL